MNIKNYKIEREDRNRHGGGVAIYIRESINHSRRDDIPLNGLELVCIEIKPVKASPFIVLAWYRPPSDPVATFEKLEQVLQFFERENKEIIVLGDTNCDLLAIEQEVSLNVEHNNTKRIKDLYQLYGLTQLISEPTRETCHTSTLIDHIAVSAASNIVESGVLKISISDHYMIFCVRKYRGALKGQHKKVNTRQMKDFDQNSFLSDISSIDWDSILNCSKDINTAVENWSNVLSMIIEKHAPMRHRRVSEKYCPWITTQLKALARTRDRLRKSAVKAGSEILMTAYRHVRNVVNKQNKTLKRQYFSDKIRRCEGDMKETWKAINQLVNKRSKTTNVSSLQEDNNILTSSDEIAESMNQYFCSIGQKLSEKIPHAENPLLHGDFSLNKNSTRFQFRAITPADIMKARQKFKVSKSFGIDGISSYFLKIGMPVLAPVLSTIFNRSISEGIFPNNWKVARVAPIYKEGPTENRSNYRPVSVLPVVSRLFEKTIFDQLYAYFDDNKLFYSHQSGFRTLHSVLTCLLKSSDDWYHDFDKGCLSSVVFIDLKKAFDTVDHTILIQKLCHYGVQGRELDWFKSYLQDRKQCCKVNGHTSKIANVNCGVPQGSCLGPLLFLIYINDLPCALKSTKVTMYADDTSISYSSKSIAEINEAVNSDLNRLQSWLGGNKLSLNVAKTQSMILGSSSNLRKHHTDNGEPKINLHINEDNLDMIGSNKYLGVQIDSELKWREHVTFAIGKISRAMGMLKYAKKYLPLEIVKNMYISIVEPHFRNCCSVWGCCGETLLDKLQKLQNRAARIVTNSSYDASSLPLIGSLGWLTIKEMIEFETATTVYKSLHGLAPEYMQSMFMKLSEYSSRSLRNTNTDLRIPSFTTSYGQRSFSY